MCLTSQLQADNAFERLFKGFEPKKRFGFSVFFVSGVSLVKKMFSIEV